MSNTRQVALKPTKNGFLLVKTKPNREVHSNESMGEWKHINWRKLERRVFKLQKRIYKASQRGDVKTVRRLQRTLMKSWYARCLSVRRVTQDNAGKKTAGVDGVKSLSPKARFRLVTKLKPGIKVRTYARDI
jgi:RNA-directed DNA polymerase